MKETTFILTIGIFFLMILPRISWSVWSWYQRRHERNTENINELIKKEMI